MDTNKINNGAINAIRGYRNQFLYTLYRLLKDINENYIFEPEGYFEDLDIKDHSGKYIETIQVKNTTGTLVFSDLFSKKDSFFKRAKKAISSDAKIIKVVCFGDLSEELKDTSLSKLKGKLIKKGFNETQIAKIANAYNYEIVSESEIQSWILLKLKKIGEFIDPNTSLDLLLFWIYKIAEKQLSVSTKELISQINLIGKYISERIDFHKSFGNTIQPLECKNFTIENANKYIEDFYFGVSAKYEHILANVDIERPKKLKEIEDAFSKSNIVFIHGASGQGKSSLAFRFLKNFQSQFAVYQLKLTNNYLEVLETINTLETLCKGLFFPVMLYIDITSQDNYWEDVIKELYDKENIHILITIRQEDWNKLSIEHHFDFSEIELNFDKSEAQLLYSQLSKHKPDLKHISFEESWEHIGENSPLLEYVYYITQGVTLKSRLKEQIKRIQEKVEKDKTKDIEVLRFVSLSDSFGSKINYKKLMLFLGIINPMLYIEYFRKEYLLQFSEDKIYLMGLHPVRSQVITEILFTDDDFVDKTDYINRTIGLIHEEDLHSFLLNAFNDNYQIDECIQTLSKLKLNTWTGFNNITKALIWKGIYDYIFIENLSIFNKFYSTYKEAWPLFMNIDFGNNDKNNAIINIIKTINKENQVQEIEKYIDLNKKLTDIENTYIYCTRWFKTDFSLPNKGISNNDWNALGEFLFRISQFCDISEIEINYDELEIFFKETGSIDSMASILLGIQESKIGNNTDISSLESNFIDKLRIKYNIHNFEISEERISSRYFFDLINFESDTSTKNPFHDKTLEILNLLRKAFPHKLEYEIKGIGYNILNIDMPDDTYKCIPRKNLPLALLTEQNSIIFNLYNNCLRKSSWQEYIDALLKQRTELLNSFILFKKGLASYFKNNISGIDFLAKNETSLIKSNNSHTLLLPKCTVDKWGYLGEKEVLLNEDEAYQTNQNLSILKFHNFLELRKEYFSSSRNFFNQCFIAIKDKVEKINNPSYIVENENLNNVTEINLFNAAYNLIKFQDQFELYFEKFISSYEHKNLSKKESNTIIELISIWKEFLYSSYRIQKSIIKGANLKFDITKKQLLIKLYTEVINKNKKTGHNLQLRNDKKNKRLVILVPTTGLDYDDSINSCIDISINIFSAMHHSSIKYLITKLNFESIAIIPLIQLHPINDKYIEIPLFRVDKIKEQLYSENDIINPFEIIKFPTTIDKDTLDKEGLSPWNNRIPDIITYEKLMSLFLSIKLILNQYFKIESEFQNLDEIGKQILSNYSTRIRNSFIDIIQQNKPKIEIIDSTNILSKDFFEIKKNNIQLLSSITTFLENNGNLQDIDLESIETYYNLLENNYVKFSEHFITSYLENTLN